MDNSMLAESLCIQDGLNITSFISATEETNQHVPCCSGVSFNKLSFFVSVILCLCFNKVRGTGGLWVIFSSIRQLCWYSNTVSKAIARGSPILLLLAKCGLDAIINFCLCHSLVQYVTNILFVHVPSGKTIGG